MSIEIFTVAQAAQYLQVCDKTIRHLINKKAIVASKIGKSWRIQKKDIEQYLKETQNHK